MIPVDCPYNVSKVKEFLTASGLTGTEYVVREYGRKIGSYIELSHCSPLWDKFGHLDQTKLRQYSDALGYPDLAAFVKVMALPFLEANQKVEEAKRKAKEMKKVERLLEKRDCLFRLTTWEPGQWDYLGCTQAHIAKALLEKTYPGQVERVITREIFNAKGFSL